MSDATGDNIQAIFSRIRGPQLRAYLLHKGWRIVAESPGGQLQLTGAIHDGGQPYELLVDLDERQGRFRRRLQRTVFVLDEIEQRPAIEIAREILATPAAAPASEIADPDRNPEAVSVGATSPADSGGETAGPVRALPIQNSDAAPLRLEWRDPARPDSRGVLELAPSRTATLLIPEGQPLPRLCHSSNGVQIEWSATSPIAWSVD